MGSSQAPSVRYRGSGFVGPPGLAPGRHSCAKFGEGKIGPAGILLFGVLWEIIRISRIDTGLAVIAERREMIISIAGNGNMLKSRLVDMHGLLDSIVEGFYTGFRRNRWSCDEEKFILHSNVTETQEGSPTASASRNFGIDRQCFNHKHHRLRLRVILSQGIKIWCWNLCWCWNRCCRHM